MNSKIIKFKNYKYMKKNKYMKKYYMNSKIIKTIQNNFKNT